MSASKNLYLRVWLVLLGLTATMIVLDRSPVGTALLRAGLVTAMLLKASLIAAYFMHLRFERMALVVTVLIGLLATGAVLFLFIMPDAPRILSLSTA